jgi:hypothetical protein
LYHRIVLPALAYARVQFVDGKYYLIYLINIFDFDIYMLYVSHRFLFKKHTSWNNMPKIKTSRVKYPEGWELIEPTLRDLEAKMREGVHICLICSTCRIFFSGSIYCYFLLQDGTNTIFLLQPRMIHMMGRGSVRPSGQSSAFLIKRAATYMISTTEGRKSKRSYMSFAWTKVMQTKI